MDNRKQKERSMEVTICGPNLRDQSKGSFHVHAADCADLARGAKREPAYADGWTINAPSQESIALDVYSDMIDEDDSLADYLADFYFFPCCALLPVTRKS